MKLSRRFSRILLYVLGNYVLERCVQLSRDGLLQGREIKSGETTGLKLGVDEAADSEGEREEVKGGRLSSS